MPVIEVESRVVGPGGGEGLDSVFFEHPADRVTVRTIILRAVEEQLRDLTVRRKLHRQEALRQIALQYETEAEILERREAEGHARSPVRPPPGPAIDLGRAQQRALRTFEVGRCLVFVGDRQMVRLDQKVEVAAGTRVRFIRLLPLRGG